MRKLAIALLAVPVLSIVYVSSVLRRSLMARTGIAVVLGAVLGLGVIAAAKPAPAAAVPPSVTLPLTNAVFKTVVATNRGLLDPVTIEFTSTMDPASVAAAVKIDPPTPVALRWDVADRLLTIVPQTHWAPSTLHSVTVDAGVLAANGVPMVNAARAAFLTRGPTTGAVAATDVIGGRVALGTGFDLTFDGPVDSASLLGGLKVDPPIAGTFATSTFADGRTVVRFEPAAPLKAATTYTLAIAGVDDADGVAISPVSTSIQTVATPGVVRFRPLDAAKAVTRDSALSVRFTKAMDRASTKAAWSVTAGGKAVAGTVVFAEHDTVLVFHPASLLPYGSKVVMSVGATAKAKDGTPLSRVVAGTFRTIEKPKPPTKVKATGGGKPSGGKPITGGGAVGGGSWGSVETYYLGLMNCTRTGGWVTSSGKCSSPGGRNVAPLKLDKGISTNVSRPYAKKLAVGGDCSHFMGGNPGDRLRHAGYDNYTWAENIGCRSGNARSAVLGSHLFFQAEKPSNGGHYVNLMNAKYDRVGIGVWVSGGRVRLVIDFYHP